MPDLIEAERELIQILEEERKRKAKKDLTEYCKYIQIPGVPFDDQGLEFYEDKVAPAKHHVLINKALMAVEKKKLKRVMIFMPPGSAKSTYCSVVFPTWFMGKNPESNIIMVSYGSKLSIKFGRKCRQIVSSPEFNQVFGAFLLADNRAADDWGLSNGSTYMSGGMLSSITGNRADGVVIDDPVKGREEADSQLIQDKTWEAYKSDILTRLKPGGWIVIIQTRWHQNDLSGKILPENYKGASGVIKSRDGENWLVISLKAICEDKDDPLDRKIGEGLWTEWFKGDYWAQVKKTQGMRNWGSIYQQRPLPEEGSYFKKEWICWYKKEDLPKHLTVYAATDYAVTDQGGDFTEMGIFGISADDDIYIIDWWRGQTSPDVWIDTQIEMDIKHSPKLWAGESGVIRRSIEPFLKKRMRDKSRYLRLEWLPSISDKASRARSFQAMSSQRKIYYPDEADWVEGLINQMLLFPYGSVDDGVDVCSLIGRIFDLMHKVSPEKLREKSPEAGTFDAITQNEEEPKSIYRRS